MSQQSASGDTPLNVLVVAHGPPLKGGIATVAMDLVDDPLLNDAFAMSFLNTSQNDDKRGKFAIANVLRAFTDAAKTYKAASRGGIVHSHSVQQPWLVGWRQVAIAAAGRLKGARVLHHNHAPPPYMEAPGEYEVGRLNRWAFAALDRLIDANILIAKAGIPNIRQYMPSVDLPVVANSVVVEDMAQTSAVHEPPVVLFIGEILERKGILTLLDALEILDNNGAKYSLQIVGDNRAGLDPDKDAMVEAINKRGRGDTMTGPLPRDGVYEQLAKADLYVFPTWNEGQPFTVIEALASGVPIVASDIQAISNMISDGPNGRLVEVHDTAGFASAIEELLDDPDRRRIISESNRALALERFDRSVFSADIAALYRKYARSK